MYDDDDDVEESGKRRIFMKTLLTFFTNLTDFFSSETLIQTIEQAFLQSLSLPLLARALLTSQLDQETIQQTSKVCFALPT